MQVNWWSSPVHPGYPDSREEDKVVLMLWLVGTRCFNLQCKEMETFGLKRFKKI